jgi:serine/threonine-protein kinase
VAVAEKRKAKGAKKNPQGAGGGKAVVAGLLLFVGACAGWLMFKPSKVLVPTLVGKSESQARQVLEDVGLSIMVRSQTTDLADQDGKVLTQEPAAGTAVPKMSVVTLVIAKGPEGLAVPDLVGKTRSEAEDELVRLALKVEFQETQSDSVPIGRVISQTPAAGQKVARQGTVVLVISGGVGDIAVPDLTNMSVAEAKAALEALGLTVDVAEVAQEDFRTGDTVYVLRQEPAAGQTLSAGSRVTIFIPIAPPVGGAASPSGASASHAPRFEGLTVSAAKKLAAEQGVVLELADSAEESRVITFQDPPPGDPLTGPEASVVIRVSESSVVPGLSGLTEAEARAQLEKAGLTVGSVKRSYGEISGEVLDQRPSAGIEAVSGSTVDIVISDPQAPQSSAQGPSATPGFTPAPWVE